MKLLLALILLFELVSPTYGAEVCEESDSAPSLVKDFIQLNKKVLAYTNNCGFIAGEDEHWFCQSLEQRNCALNRSSQNYWYCEALLKNNCNLTSGANLWMCESLLQKNCSLVKGEEHYFCESIVRKNCNLTKGYNYWLCRGLTDVLNGVISPSKKAPEIKKDVPLFI